MPHASPATGAFAAIELASYWQRRVRWSQEVLGEAIAALGHSAPEVFASITKARRIVDFRNQLTHEYSSISDTLVWGIVERDVLVLRAECEALVAGLNSAGRAD